MTAQRHRRTAPPTGPTAGDSRAAEPAPTSPGGPDGHDRPEPAGTDSSPWLTLTDLGRLYGISALHCGRLLSDAGLRDADGQPTASALEEGCASGRQRQRQGNQPFWHREGCRGAFEAVGLETVQRATLVQQWAALLEALTQGSPSITTSAAQMAEELPSDLVEPVNLQLRQLGCSFQVERGRGRSFSRPGGARSGASREPEASRSRRGRREHAGAARPRNHGASGAR